MKTLGMMLKEQIESQKMNEMSNLLKNDTGLPVIVWFCGETEVEHNTPRIKFQNSYSNKIQPRELVPMSIEDEPKILIKNLKLNISERDIEKIRSWVREHKETLLKYWRYEISTKEAINLLSK